VIGGGRPLAARSASSRGSWFHAARQRYHANAASGRK